MLKYPAVEMGLPDFGRNIVPQPSGSTEDEASNSSIFSMI